MDCEEIGLDVSGNVCPLLDREMTSNQVDDDVRFYRDLATDDSITITVKGAIYVEREIRELLASQVYDPSMLDKIDLTYWHRIQLAVAFGLHPRFQSPLKKLGEIRNKFAHVLRDDLNAEDVKQFYDSFGPEEKSLIQATYAKIRSAGSAKTKRPKKLSSLPPADQFQIYVTTLRAALLAAKKQAPLIIRQEDPNDQSKA